MRRASSSSTRFPLKRIRDCTDDKAMRRNFETTMKPFTKRERERERESWRTTGRSSPFVVRDRELDPAIAFPGSVNAARLLQRPLARNDLKDDAIMLSHGCTDANLEPGYLEYP